jgi:hypothetical protein
MVEQDDGAVGEPLPSADSLRPAPLRGFFPPRTASDRCRLQSTLTRTPLFGTESILTALIPVNFDLVEFRETQSKLTAMESPLTRHPTLSPSWIRRVPKGTRGIPIPCPCRSFPAGIVCPRFRSVLSFSAKLSEEWDDEPTMPTLR